VKDKLWRGYQAAGKSFKVHLDGYDQRDLLAGTGPGKREEYFYWTDDGNLAGLRYNRWKLVFMEQRSEGLDVWQNPLVPLRFPKLIDLRADPFERAQTDAGDYARWRVEHALRSFPRRPTSPTPRTYREFRRGRSPAASRSTRCWRSSKSMVAGRGNAPTGPPAPVLAARTATRSKGRLEELSYDESDKKHEEERLEGRKRRRLSVSADRCENQGAE
jgi:arylsulfatase A-like enzyme